MSRQEEKRRFAREDLARVIHQHRIKMGESLPTYRESEKAAEERADLIDKKKDAGLKEL